MAQGPTHAARPLAERPPNIVFILADDLGINDLSTFGARAVDLLPLATGQTQEAPHDAIFWQSGDYRVVRRGTWKLQVSERPAKVWLFDLAADPTERTNLAELRPDRVAELQALLDAHRANARPPLYPSTIEAPIAVDASLAEPVGPDDEIVYWPN